MALSTVPPVMGMYPQQKFQDPGHPKVVWKSNYGRLLYLVFEYGSLPLRQRMMPKIVLFVLLLSEFGYLRCLPMKQDSLNRMVYFICRNNTKNDLN